MSGLPWIRLYTRAVDNEKLRLLAFEDRWHFIALLCLKGDGILDERSELRDRKIAVKLGLSLSELDAVKKRLKEVELIDDDFQPLGWEEHQFLSDNSTNRVRKFREKQRERTGNEARNEGETFQKRSRNVIDTDTDTDTDTEEEVEEEKEKKADPSQATAQPDPVWSDGVKWLESKGCKNIRPYLGKLCKDYGSDAVVLAIDQARTQNPVEPKSYLLEILKSPKRRRNGVDDPSLPNWLRGAI